MKKLTFVLIVLFAASQIIFAQEPEKDVKKADKLLGLYFLDTKASASKLWEAKALIDATSANESVAGLYKTWKVKGDIYNAVASTQNDSLVIAETMKKEVKLSFPNAGVLAYEALMKAKGLAVKSFETKDVISALQEVSRYLNNIGFYSYKKQDFANAYANFNSNVMIDKVVKESGAKGIFNNDNDYMNQLYIVSLCAIGDKKPENAITYLNELRSKNYDDESGAGANIYESLISYYSEKNDSVQTETIMAEGRKKYPNANNLLFTEINYFLKKGKLNSLIDKLKEAMVKEPNNTSIPITLGNVYDNLCQKEWEAGHMEEGNKYYEEGVKLYSDAIAKDANNFNASYSLAALYYNKAAQISKEVNKYASDYSKAGTQKYEEKKAEMNSYFDKALPHFLAADKLDPKDTNTILALKEIYARKNQFDKSNEYKARLEALKK